MAFAKVEHFRDDHDRILRILYSTTERGSYCGAQLLIPDGKSRDGHHALKLSSTIAVPISGESILGITKLAAIAHLCPLHEQWGRRTRPSLPELFVIMSKVSNVIDRTVCAPNQPQEETAVRTALTELHQRITDYLAQQS